VNRIKISIIKIQLRMENPSPKSGGSHVARREKP
jgi:hypothetical protein